MKKLLALAFIVFFYYTVNAQYIWNNNATKDNCHCYTLTSDANNQSGSVWNSNKIDLTQSFDFKFDVYLGCNDGSGADGIAFVLQPVSTSIGGQGGGMGFSGINPSVGVTLDTYQNTGDPDPAYDHIDIQYNGDVRHSATPPPISANTNNVEDCKWHTLRVKWNAATKNLETYFDDRLRMTRSRDIVKEIFNNNPMVYWGFTGATGGARNLQQFCTALTPIVYFLPGQKKCIGEPVQFYDSTRSFGPVKSRSWDFGDGSPLDTTPNPIHTYTVANDYDVILKVEGADGCVEQLKQTVRIGSYPVADIAVNNVCAETPASFKDNSTVTVGTIDKWNWDLGFGLSSIHKDTSVIYSGKVNGTNNEFDIKLTVVTKEGCASQQVSKKLTIYNHPVAKFKQDISCEGNASLFTDQSDFNGVGTSTINGSIDQWKWDFEGGVASDKPAPSIVPAAINTKATLIVTSSNGCKSKSFTQTINISPSPQASFTIPVTQKMCINESIEFKDASQPSLDITKYSWDFGDGNKNETEANPSHSYISAGDYTVVLTITNAKGCTDKFEKLISIGVKPLANFSFNNACSDSIVNFKFESTGDNITGWNWDLGNGFTSTEENPTKVYSSLINGMQNIPVTLSVTSSLGCVSDPSAAKLLTIYAHPVAKFTQAGACAGSPFGFKDASFFSAGNNVVNGDINKWQWDFGYGITSVDKDPTVLLNAATNTSATLIVTSSNGCSSKPATEPIRSAVLPVVDFDPGVICATGIAKFTDRSTIENSIPIINWQWDLGNGDIQNVQDPVTSYLVADTVNVTLEVKAANGCSVIKTKPVVINALPVAKIEIVNNTLCENKIIQFESISATAAGSDIKKWYWNFDNTVAAIIENPAHIFTSGNHTAQLTVRNSLGCESLPVTQNFVINPKPLIDYDFPAGGCLKTDIQFSGINKSGEAIDKWYWKFGDKKSAIAKDPVHNYRTNGNYTAELYAVSLNGCYSDTLNQKNIIIYGTNVSAGLDINATYNQPVQLKATGGESYTWSPSDGLSNTTIADPVALLSRDQTYKVKAVTAQGCESEDEITVKMYAGPDIYVPGAFTVDGNGLNDVLYSIPVGITLFENFSVYNRYGQLVFSTTDYRKGWDGRSHGQAQDPGAYIWIAKGIDYKGNKVFRKGTVILIR